MSDETGAPTPAIKSFPNIETTEGSDTSDVLLHRVSVERDAAGAISRVMLYVDMEPPLRRAIEVAPGRKHDRPEAEVVALYVTMMLTGLDIKISGE